MFTIRRLPTAALAALCVSLAVGGEPPVSEGASAPYSLDAEGVRQLTLGRRPVLVKFVSAPREQQSLDQLWSDLAVDFEGSGLGFASVDCAVHADACLQRKVSPANMDGPVIKFWTGNGFRRYSGYPDRDGLRHYLAKKLHAMHLAGESANAPSARTAQAGGEDVASRRAEREARAGYLPKESLEVMVVNTLTGCACAGLLAALFYLYASRRPLPPSADYLLVLCAQPAAAPTPTPPGAGAGGEGAGGGLPPTPPRVRAALVGVDGASGLPTPLSLVPMLDALPCPASLVSSPRGPQRVVALHAPVLLPVDADDEGAEGEAAKLGAAGGRECGFGTWLLQPDAAPCMLESAVAPLQIGHVCATAVVRSRATGVGWLTGRCESIDRVAIAASDGALYVATLTVPTALPTTEGDPGVTERSACRSANTRPGRAERVGASPWARAQRPSSLAEWTHERSRSRARRSSPCVCVCGQARKRDAARRDRAARFRDVGAAAGALRESAGAAPRADAAAALALTLPPSDRRAATAALRPRVPRRRHRDLRRRRQRPKTRRGGVGARALRRQLP